ncbi:MAG: SMI1/KNR4 family protein [Hyphomicrobiales bacterium]
MTEDEIIAAVREIAERQPEPQTYPPLSARDIPAVEAQIGFALPALLVRVYTEICDGGFGPGFGMEDLRDAARIYVRYRDDPYAGDWKWPTGMLPLLHHGCGIYDCVHCTRPETPMMQFEPNAVSQAESFIPRANSLGEWLAGGCC